MMQNDWKLLLAVPLTAFALIVPTLAFSTDPKGATQFFGTLAGATIAAAAVIGNAQYQAKLTRQRDERLKKETQIEKAVELYGFIHFLVAKLQSIAVGLDHVTFSDAADPKESDISIMNIGAIRQVLNSDFKIGWDRAIECASTLPVELARRVLSNIYLVRHDSVAFYSFAALPDTMKPRRSDIKTLVARVKQMKDCMIADRKAIAGHLQSVGALFEMPPDDK